MVSKRFASNLGEREVPAPTLGRCRRTGLKRSAP
jgi:hypothetical protein